MMGEARRKLDADACGIPRPRDHRCPGCGSKRIMDMPTAELRAIAAGISCDWQACRDCRAVWEPFPPDYARDPVCADPCDNCAFRPGSPEQGDPERWKALIASLKPDTDYQGFGGRFYCHKGVPIDMTKGPGNFLFPQKPVVMDGNPLCNPDGTIVTAEDVGRMRICSGFLRMVWARNRKAEG
jgi:hypothetical protein